VAFDEWREKLDRYLDGELTPEEGAALSAHLRGCAACTAEVLERVQIKRAVQVAARRYTPSAEFRKKITKSVAAKSQGGIAGRWRLVLIPALLVLVAAFWLNSYGGRERAARQRVYSELADLHVATLASATQVDVISSDRHTVKPWFLGKVDFSPRVPDLSPHGYPLSGGRLDYLTDRPVVALVYHRRDHLINVFTWPAMDDQDRPVHSLHRQGFLIRTWQHSGMIYWAISDLNDQELDKFVSLFQNV